MEFEANTGIVGRVSSEAGNLSLAIVTDSISAPGQQHYSRSRKFPLSEAKTVQED
jgi:hypothetical protein